MAVVQEGTQPDEPHTPAVGQEDVPETGDTEDESPTIRRIRQALHEVNRQTHNNLLARGGR